MLNKKDLQIIASLRKNSRDRLTKISKELKIPVTTIYNIIKRNEKEVILRNTVLIDFTKIGFGARAQVCFSIDKRQKKNFMNTIMTHPNVNSLYKINNGFDCMAEVIFRDLREMEEFFEQLEERYNVKKKEVHHIITDLRKEEFFSDHEKIETICN